MKIDKSGNSLGLSQNQTNSQLDAISLILKQAGKTAEEVAALATLDDALQTLKVNRAALESARTHHEVVIA